MPMTATIHTTAPPGYITIGEAVQQLGITNQLFHASGLARQVDCWRINRTATLYRQMDIERLARWLVVRRSQVNAGERHPNSPLAPNKEEWNNVV